MKIFKNFILTVFLLLPVLSFSQSKPTRDKSKDMNSVISNTWSKHKRDVSKRKMPKKEYALPNSRDRKMSYTSRHRSNTGLINHDATYLLVDQKSDLQKSYGFNYAYETFYVSKTFHIVGLPSWCTVSKNHNSFILTLSNNESHEKRADWFWVKSGNQVVRIDISQDGKPLNISASFDSINMCHNMCGDTYKGYNLDIATRLTIQGAMGQRCLVVAYVLDENYKYIKASRSFSNFALPFGEVYAVTEITPLYDSPQIYNLILRLPNNAILLDRRKCELRCELRVYCTTTREFVSNSYFTPIFSAKLERGQVITKP